MTYRDPDAPLAADAPTEAYRTVPDAPAGPEPLSTERATVESSAATVPVRTPGPRRGLRWAVALVVTALVVTSAAAAVFMMAGKAPAASVLRWVPATSLAYGEMRLDLPGDQRAKLGEFLSQFPGFRDQASLETKINEALDRLVSGGTDGAQTFTRDIAPWFGGEVAFSMGELPSAAALSGGPGTAPAPEAAVFVSVKDGAAARAWIEAAIEDASPTTEDYNGTPLTLVASTHGPGVEMTMAYALPGDEVLVIGQVDAVKAAIDTRGASGLSSDEHFAAALAASDDDHVGFMYLNMRAYVDWAMDLSEGAGADACGTSVTSEMVDMVPAWVGMRLRIDGDALVMDGTSPIPDGLDERPTNRPSTLARHLPASTIAFAESHDLGSSILDSIDVYRSDPACSDAIKEIDSIVGMIGGFDGLFGWMGDAGIAINRTADGVEGGILIQAADAAKARNLLLTLRSFAALGGSQLGISIRDEAYGDHTITILDAGDAANLMELGGGGAGPDIEPPGGPGSRVELAWTVTDDLVVLAVGVDFVKHVLDTDEADSLAADGRFNGLIERTGKDNVGAAFADVAALRELIEGAMDVDPDAKARYEEEVKPFLLPFDAFVMSSRIDGELSRVNAIITTR